MNDKEKFEWSSPLTESQNQFWQILFNHNVLKQQVALHSKNQTLFRVRGVPPPLEVGMFSWFLLIHGVGTFGLLFQKFKKSKKSIYSTENDTLGRNIWGRKKDKLFVQWRWLCWPFCLIFFLKRKETEEEEEDDDDKLHAIYKERIPRGLSWNPICNKMGD